ncbi:MAG: gliding motility protein GldN [Bacteroidales bacterium]|nr:gliding motility protein GldN [Bacteroidales bacterium]
MKKILLNIFVVAALGLSASAQSIIDADDSRNFNDYYEKGLVAGKRAIPYPYLRESDVVWESYVWRNIDFNEKYNQFFYFPVDTTSNTQGRISIVNLILRAASNGDIEVFEDDDMKVPQDWEKAYSQMKGKSKKVEQVYIEEWDDYDTRDTVVPTDFDPASVKMLQLKESWYIDKQDTRQKVRILAMAFRFEKDDVQAGEEVTMPATSFWVPMDDMRVRQVLVNANAYDENNNVAENTYDDVFIQRRFDSYITRENNRHNRAISAYLTGEDAIIQSQIIEDKIFDIESDMWEY